MRTLAFSRYAISIGIAAAVLSACGVIPQTSALGTGPTIAHGSPPAYRVVYRFRGEHAGDGSYPEGALIDVKGRLYGTTLYGGSSGDGTVYSVSTSGVEKILHTFTGKPADAANPAAGLVDVKGTLYGTTFYGGSYGDGTVYSISTSGVETVLYSFVDNGADGFNPAAGLIDVGGALYGTTENGGSYGGGTVYSITMGGTENVLHSFGAGTDGAHPLASLIDVKGTLYGTTSYGGDSTRCRPGCGTLFSTTTSGKETVLYSFGKGTDARVPVAGLTDVNGSLYGTTYWGSNSLGTVFSVTTGGTEKVLYSFGARTDGAHPEASLIDVQGTLYGTTFYGGELQEHRGGCGTVYRITARGSEKEFYTFDCNGLGRSPAAGLINVNGTMYGTTALGGTSGPCTHKGTGCGVVFALAP